VRFDGAAKASIDPATLQPIIDGIDSRSIRRFRRYRASHAAGHGGRAVGAGALAGLAMSPLGWDKLIAELAYGA